MVDIFLTFLRPGATSFGGPVAHLAVFREELVHRRGWMTDAALAGYGLVQAMPGPIFTFASFLGAVAAGPLGADGAVGWRPAVGSRPRFHQRHPKAGWLGGRAVIS